MVEDWSEIASALLELSNASDNCRSAAAASAASTDWPGKSPAAHHRAAEAPLVNAVRGPAPVSHAQGEILLCDAAAVDHLASLAGVLMMPGNRGFSVATLARGAVEASGRAWWLLSAGTAEELTRRWLTGRLNSLRWLVKETANDPSAQAANKELHAELAADALSLGATKADLQLSYTKLATQVINAAIEPGSGEILYARLSAVAHAERSGLASMLTRVGESPVPGASTMHVALPANVLADILLPALAAQGLVQSAIADYFAVSDEVRTTWARQLDGCLTLLRSLR